MTKSNHEFHCPGVHLRCKILLFLHGIFEEGEKSTEAFVIKQCESDLDEIYSLNSTVFGYKLCFYDKSFQKKYSVFFSQYLKSIQVLI